MADKEDTQRRVGVLDRFVLIVIFRIPLTEFEINESSKVKLPFLFPPPNPLGHSDTVEPSRHTGRKRVQERQCGTVVVFSLYLFYLFQQVQGLGLQLCYTFSLLFLFLSYPRLYSEINVIRQQCVCVCVIEKIVLFVC